MDDDLNAKKEEKEESKAEQTTPAMSYFDVTRNDPVATARRALSEAQQKGIFGLLGIALLLLIVPLAVIYSLRPQSNKGNATNPVPAPLHAFIVGHVFFDHSRDGMQKDTTTNALGGVEIDVDGKRNFTDSQGNFSSEVTPGTLDANGNALSLHHIKIIPLFGTVITTGSLEYDRQANSLQTIDNAVALTRANNPYGLHIGDASVKPLQIGLGRVTDPKPNFIQGYTFVDSDGNGVFDKDIEATIAHVSISINGQQVTSDASGFYRVNGLDPAGTYQISVTLPAGISKSTIVGPNGTGRVDIGFK